jgi:Flp pilus assembly protein TadD
VLHNDLGVLYYEAGDKENALASYKQAVRLAPNEPNYHKNLADFYIMEEGRAEEAMKLYVEVLSLNPLDIEALNATGMICTALGKINDARYFYERVLEIEPFNEDAANALKNLLEVIAEEFSSTKIDCVAD